MFRFFILKPNRHNSYFLENLFYDLSHVLSLREGLINQKPSVSPCIFGECAVEDRVHSVIKFTLYKDAPKINFS